MADQFMLEQSWPDGPWRLTLTKKVSNTRVSIEFTPARDELSYPILNGPDSFEISAECRYCNSEASLTVSIPQLGELLEKHGYELRKRETKP